MHTHTHMVCIWNWWNLEKGSVLHQGQFPGCDTVLLLYKMLPLEKQVKGIKDHSILSCNWMWIHNYLQDKSVINTDSLAPSLEVKFNRSGGEGAQYSV